MTANQTPLPQKDTPQFARAMACYGQALDFLNFMAPVRLGIKKKTLHQLNDQKPHYADGLVLTPKLFTQNKDLVITVPCHFDKFSDAASSWSMLRAIKEFDLDAKKSLGATALHKTAYVGSWLACRMFGADADIFTGLAHSVADATFGKYACYQSDYYATSTAGVSFDQVLDETKQHTVYKPVTPSLENLLYNPTLPDKYRMQQKQQNQQNWLLRQTKTAARLIPFI